ncbi:MAG: zinc metallopeptidase [Lachnospiraceae bacterium]|nr:zinc metallopeptidase [Lachnospiraceae bacterium]
MFYYYDPTYILVLIGVALSLWASANVNSAIAKYRKVQSMSGQTAAGVARKILQENGIYNVTVKQISQGASDYYNPATKEVCLLAANYNSNSIASIGIAAHECGHAIQDATEYLPLAIQRHLAPICALGSQAGFYVVLAGLLFGMDQVVNLGIVLFTMGVFITVLLLPIEFDASSRALKILEGRQILSGEELKGARKVLTAAGLTYVAAAAASILSLLRLLLIARSNRRD